MEFAKLIQACHPEDIGLQINLKIYCKLCHKVIIDDIYEYIKNHSDTIYAADVARTFYEWTGDDKVPLPFVITDIDGILSKRIISQNLHQVRESIQLLRAINAPFTKNPHPQMSDAMYTFMNDYLKSVSNKTEKDPIQQIVEAMHQLLESKEFTNPFDFYFSKLVPFTQSCVSKWETIDYKPVDSNLAKELWIQLNISNTIRKTFGIYSISFDVFHAMVASYSCLNDYYMIGNWVLDFMTRICRGHYFWKNYPDCTFVKHMNYVINTEITRKNHLPLLQLIKQIRQGNAIEVISNNWHHYIKLIQIINENFHIPQMTCDVIEMACYQMFPAVLFEDYLDHLGFTLATCHVISTVNPKTGQFTKGAFKKARYIYNFIQKMVTSINEFDDKSLYWTVDTLHLYLASQPDLRIEIAEVMKLFLTQE